MFERSVVCVFVAAGLILSACTSISWTSPEISKLNDTNGPLEGRLTTTETSWIGSLLTVGCIFGPFLGGFLADYVGRKRAYLIMTVPVIVSYVICAFATNLFLFYVARFLSGLALSAIQTVNAIYVGEMVTDEYRGMLSSVLLIALNSGVLLCYCVGPYTSVKFFNLFLATIPSVFFIAFIMFGLETPYYYAAKNQDDKAKKCLLHIKGHRDELANKELEEIQKNIIKKKEYEKAGIKDLLGSKATIKSLTITIGLFTFQQLSGSVAVLSYTQFIFEDAGSSVSPEISSILLGILQLAASLWFPFILNKFGRKTIVFCSAVVMAISEIILGIYFILKENQDMSSFGVLPVICLCLYIVGINNGVGPIPVVFLSEIFPDNVKAPATSISIVWCWFLAFLVSRFFQPLSDFIGIGKCFLGFGVICAFCVVFTHFVVIETKGKTLKEIQDKLGR